MYRHFFPFSYCFFVCIHLNNNVRDCVYISLHVLCTMILFNVHKAGPAQAAVLAWCALIRGPRDVDEDVYSRKENRSRRKYW